MITKISRGQRMTGLLVYLLGPGESNEHKDRHIIAGSATVLRSQFLQHFDGEVDKQAARDVAVAVAHELDIPRQLYGTKVRMRAKPARVAVGARQPGDLGMDVVEPAAKGERSEMRDAPVWHAIIALNPGEELTDERWAQLADEFMSRMGFTGTPDGKVAPARWAAVRHGHSGEHGEGQDHIHIAASLVREDGSKVSTFDYGPGKARGDWNRAYEVAGELEREYGLQVLPSREQGGGLSGDSRAEIERAAREGRPESERERLRRTVRAVATAADSELEFVEQLREAGVAVAPRWAAGGREKVTGYKVRMRRGDAEVGPWLGGGKLAGDLTLTALREQQWDDSPEGRAAAVAAWRGRSTATGAGRGTTGLASREEIDRWRQAAMDARRWRESLAEIPHGDRAQWAYAAGQAAGVMSAWAEMLEGDQPGAFASAAKELTRSAQLPRGVRRYRPQSGVSPLGRRGGFGDAARLILDASGRAGQQARRGADADDVAAQLAAVVVAVMLALLLIAIAVAMEVARAHRARGELARALAVERVTGAGLDPVRARWESDLETRRHQWDRDAADVFTEVAARRADKRAGHDLDDTAEARGNRAEEQVGEQRLAALAAAAEDLVPGITATEAWPALRRRLADLEVSGRDTTADLAAAVGARELGTADDPAAVLVWRLERLDTAPQPDATPPDTGNAADRPHRARRGAVAAAQGPLTPPRAARTERRRYYTELTDEEKIGRRINIVVATQDARNDLQPRAWSDEELAHELRARRTEVQLLADELAQRRADPPHTRQALADNAALTEKAGKIPAAQRAEEAAKKLAAQQRRLEAQQRQLEQQLADTPRRKMLARWQLEQQLAETTAQLGDLTPQVAAAQDTATRAADATGSPAHEWSDILREAGAPQQRWRLTDAQARDQRDLSEDENYLSHLRRNLDKVDREATRRDRLTPQQRERDTAQRVRDTGPRRQPRRTVAPPTPGLEPPPYRAPEPRRDQGPDLGL